MTPRRLCNRALPTTFAGLVAAGAVVASALAGTTVKSPRALYQALLTTGIRSDLPSGFYSAQIGVGSLSDRAKRFHAVGEVDIDIDSGNALIIYIVFPSRANAVAEWNDARSDVKKHSKSILPAPPTFPWPALIANGSVTGKNAFDKSVTNGVTDLAFTSKNVIVQAMTLSTSNTESGDIPGAIRLGKAALKHLNKLRR